MVWHFFCYRINWLPRKSGCNVRSFYSEMGVCINRDLHVRLKKWLILSEFHILGHQAMNSTLQSRYCLEGGLHGTRQFSLITPDVNAWQVHTIDIYPYLHKVGFDTRSLLYWGLVRRRRGSHINWDSHAAGHRYTRPEGKMQVGHCLSLIHLAQCESRLINACRQFTWLKRPSAIWIFACHWYPSRQPLEINAFKILQCVLYITKKYKFT